MGLEQWRARQDCRRNCEVVYVITLRRPGHEPLKATFAAKGRQSWMAVYGHALGREPLSPNALHPDTLPSEGPQNWCEGTTAPLNRETAPSAPPCKGCAFNGRRHGKRATLFNPPGLGPNIPRTVRRFNDSTTALFSVNAHRDFVAPTKNSPLALPLT